MKSYHIWVTNPEDYDSQYIWIRETRKQNPSFKYICDYINDPDETNIIINNIDNARRWVDEILGLDGFIKEFDFVKKEKHE